MQTRAQRRTRRTALARRLGWTPVLAAAIVVLAAAPQEHEPGCARLEALVREVYGFRPSQLTAEEQKEKGADMDRVWKLVEGNPAELAPACDWSSRSPLRTRGSASTAALCS